MEICFMGVVAMGENAWAPSSGHLPSSSREEEVGSGWMEDNISADYTNSLNADGESTMREVREDDLDDISDINKVKKRKLASSSRGSKKNGASRIDDYLQRVCGAMESRSRKTVSIEDVMKEISKFPRFGPDSDLFYVSTRLMIHKHYREMFMALKDPVSQQSWLRSFHKDNPQNKRSTVDLTVRDVRKLSSLMWHQDELLNKKRRWLVGSPALFMLHGIKNKLKRPRFFMDECLTESYVRSDEVSYDNVRDNVAKSFGVFNKSQRQHHVVQDYQEFFETFNIERVSINASYYIRRFCSREPAQE